jgi:hypothetical protein
MDANRPFGLKRVEACGANCITGNFKNHVPYQILARW